MCPEEGCPWRIYISQMRNGGRYQVKIYVSDHTCEEIFDNRRVTSRVIVEYLKDIILLVPTIKTEVINKLMWNKLKARANNGQCRKAKFFIFQDKGKEFMKEFEDIRRYPEELRVSNPGSPIELQNFFPRPGAQPHFKRFYICFDALKKGFLKGCRPFIGLDGCFFKGTVKGEILVVVGRDGNNQMFPIAWAIVESESRSSWQWFLELISRDLGLKSGQGWTLMSDQQKGLIAAVEDMVPEAEHRMCVRHLYANWRKTYKGDDIKIKYWGAFKSPNLCKMWDNLKVTVCNLSLHNL